MNKRRRKWKRTILSSLTKSGKFTWKVCGNILLFCNLDHLVPIKHHPLEPFYAGIRVIFRCVDCNHDAEGRSGVIQHNREKHGIEIWFIGCIGITETVNFTSDKTVYKCLYALLAPSITTLIHDYFTFLSNSRIENNSNKKNRQSFRDFTPCPNHVRR